MIKWLLNWVSGGLAGALTKAYEAKLAAQNDSDRIAADVSIKAIEAQMAASATSAAVVKEGMQHKVFWIPWLIAAVPAAAWFGWGMTDSLFNSALPMSHRYRRNSRNTPTWFSPTFSTPGRLAWVFKPSPRRSGGANERP